MHCGVKWWSMPFSHIQFEFSNSLLCRFAVQQVLGIYPLPVPALPVCRSTPFSHVQFEFSSSSLCRFANQQVSDIHLLPLPALPVCQSTDQRLFHTYRFVFSLETSLLLNFFVGSTDQQEFAHATVENSENCPQISRNQQQINRINNFALMHVRFFNGENM